MTTFIATKPRSSDRGLSKFGRSPTARRYPDRKVVGRFIHMGQSRYSGLFRKIDQRLSNFYALFPTTYLGILRRVFEPFLSHPEKEYSVLDLACGDGSATGFMGLPRNFHIYGVELYRPYVDLARKSGIYTQVYQHDIRTFLTSQKYDIIIASHVIEHLSAAAGQKLIASLFKHARKMILVATPIGDLPQGTYDGNYLQIHRSRWSVADFRNHGFHVKSQGMKFLWQNRNVGLDFGLFSYIFFLISFLLSPLLLIKPEWGTYMICYRYLDE